MKLFFWIPAPILGYRASARRAFDERYRGYKKRVLALAILQGWKERARSSKEWPVKLSVFVYWKANPRIDWKNVYGAIEDSLFKEDRHVIPGIWSGVKWDTGRERAEVIIEC